jgi:hypothetical protein
MWRPVPWRRRLVPASRPLRRQLTDRYVGQMTDRHVVIGQADTGSQASMLMRSKHDENAGQPQA